MDHDFPGTKLKELVEYPVSQRKLQTLLTSQTAQSYVMSLLEETKAHSEKPSAMEGNKDGIVDGLSRPCGIKTPNYEGAPQRLRHRASSLLPVPPLNGSECSKAGGGNGSQKLHMNERWMREPGSGAMALGGGSSLRRQQRADEFTGVGKRKQVF
ncbi:hypothetical protein CCH79_00018600 [Gambusia affinis]|uniref:Uncharacterized protein n=1 Tax=Gambusia affinis TaxID=33528 RepID=A0A315VIM4_GAMAF|nr:hypothetical protein CCH79_00018600 [Gambusia affinis]